MIEKVDEKAQNRKFCPKIVPNRQNHANYAEFASSTEPKKWKVHDKK